jgi:mannose-1-phosphate guanylyltransferase
MRIDEVDRTRECRGRKHGLDHQSSPNPSRRTRGFAQEHRQVVATGCGNSPSGGELFPVARPLTTLPSTWTIVLAGGEGRRLRPLMERWFGEHRPKQYCTFVGGRSMLWHTVGRAEQLSGAERMLIVAADHHEALLTECLAPRHLGRIVFQPRNRDTAPGIFLPLAQIMAREPTATVVILPSDHFVAPEPAFLEAVRRAAMVAAHLPGKVILVGARPDSEETEYGWIEPGEPVGRLGGYPIRKVAGFCEKPDETSVRQLVNAGGLWSTMVIAARCQALWDLGWRCFPAMMPHFEHLMAHFGTDQERPVLESIYTALPAMNFSAQLLQRVPGSLLVMELGDVTWSDWGSERRIVETLNRLGKRPSFPSCGVLQDNALNENDTTLSKMSSGAHSRPACRE